MATERCPRKCQGILEEVGGSYECSRCQNTIRKSVYESMDSFKRVALSGGPAAEIAQAALGTLDSGIDPRYVYAIENEVGLIKIGKSVNPKRRVRELSTGNPQTLELLASKKFDRAGEVEEELHNRFERHRVNGEWFDLDDWGRLEIIDELGESGAE